jgi:hypothetical protein
VPTEGVIGDPPTGRPGELKIIPLPSGTPRWISTDSDGVHAQSQRIGPWVENSTFAGIGDDVANSYTTALKVTTVIDSRTIRLQRIVAGGLVNFPAKHFRAGENLQLFHSKTGELLLPIRIQAVDAVAQTVTLDAPLPSAVIQGWASYVAFNKDLSAGFVVEDSTFRDSRRYGIWTKSDDGLIADNTFSGLGSSAVICRNEAQYAEGITSDNLAIVGNQFSNIGRSYNYLSYPGAQFAAVIDVHLTVGAQSAYATSMHYISSNVEIRGNTFSSWCKRAVNLRNVENATVAANWFQAPQAGWGTIATEARFCGTVTIERNFIPLGCQNLFDGTVLDYRFRGNHVF